MLKELLALVVTGVTLFSPAPKFMAEVDRTEGDYAVTLVYKEHNNRTDMYIWDIPQKAFNEFKEDGEDLQISVVDGVFTNYNSYYTYEDGKSHYSVIFKSKNGGVEWYLEDSDLNILPIPFKNYNLIYYDNGTEDVNDDIFLGVY